MLTHHGNEKIKIVRSLWANTPITERPFSHQLAHYRTRANMSQSSLANLCNVDHSYISRLEANQRFPSREFTLQLKESLDLSFEESVAFFHAAGYSISGTIYIDPNSDLGFIHKYLLRSHPKGSLHTVVLTLLSQIVSLIQTLEESDKIKEKASDSSK